MIVPCMYNICIVHINHIFSSFIGILYYDILSCILQIIIYIFYTILRYMFNSEELFNEVSICEFCGVNLDVQHEHTRECPVNFINPANYQNIVNAQYDIEEELSHAGDIPRELGMQLLLAVDTILEAQRNWAHKSLMSKFNEVLNRYTDLTSFVRALYNSGVLNTAEDIINFLELPEEYDELFAVWMEHGQPTSDEIDSWNIFLSSVQLRGWQKKNKS